MSWLLAIGAGLVIGPVVGSFVTNWALRYAREEQAVSGRSRCEHCGGTLSFAASTPVLSYLVLRGRCGICRAPIDPTHLAGEVAGAVILLSALLAPNASETCLRAMLGFLLLALAIVDLKRLRLPNALTALTAVTGGAIAFLRGDLFQGLVAAAVLSALLLCLRQFIRRGSTPGMGLGDVKLVAGLSLWLGASSFMLMALASLLCLAWVMARKDKASKTPFGPALASSAVIVASLRDVPGVADLLYRSAG